MGLERLLGITDDVFAFAITLLVLDLVTPFVLGPATNSSLAAAIADEGWAFLGFFVSFWVIGMNWLGHHRTFRYIKSCDMRLLWMNLLFLFFIVLMPFVTRVLDSYESLSLAILVYASVQIGASLTSAFMWRYASKGRRLVDRQVSDHVITWLWRRSFIAPVAFAISVPLAFVSHYLPIACWLALLPLMMLLDRHFGKGIAG
jgi:uncharacterized membrane protein